MVEIGSKVRVIKSEAELIQELMSEWEMTRPEAIGTAKILREEESTVIGVQLLTDIDSVEKPFVSLMTHDGFMYIFHEEDVETW